MKAFDYAGKQLNKQDIFNDNFSFLYAFDDVSSTNYTVFRINKKRIDGTNQFPFLRYFSTMITGSTLTSREGWNFVINGGTGTGLIIENSIVIDDTTLPVETGAIPLSINQNGDLGYLDVDFIGKGQTYVQQGVVSAMCGFFPIIDNYEDFNYPTDIPGTNTEAWQHAQRQIIGQFGNGDYLIITSEGRDFDNSIGLTMTDAQRICKKLGVKFAYNLDGGGSVQTYVGKRKTNILYTSGERVRGTFIVFNGTDTFNVPN